MIIASVQDLVRYHEGCRLEAYQDQGGVWTIGWGCTGPDIVKGTVWSQEQADEELIQRIAIACARAQMVLGHEDWIVLSEPRQAALIDMAYDLGGTGLAKFRHMLSAIRDQDWLMAHDQALDSQWARQVPNRAKDDAMMLWLGQWLEVST